MRCWASQPVVGLAPPWVSERRMYSTWVMRPEPEGLAAFRRSQGMEVASEDGLFWRSSPLMELPSFDFQMGPAPWDPMGLPETSRSVASGA